MIKGKTKSGYKFSVDEKRLNDWEVFEAIADMTSGEEQRMIQGTVSFINTVLGEDKQNLIKFVKSKNDGYCPQDQMQILITEIVESVNEIKNSQSSQG